MQLWDWCIPREITFLMVHLAGTDNQEASALSRQMLTTHEWELDRPTCHRLFRTWGSPDIDLFATHTNKALHRRSTHVCDAQMATRRMTVTGPQSKVSRCQPNEHNCLGTELCIPMTKLCNGERDCVDGSDEGPHCRGAFNNLAHIVVPAAVIERVEKQQQTFLKMASTG
ncbi:Low-density lipoprotein receptor-related protein 1 [Varanus komodoensis]|nr:Low-density lipoprotein receptor-related protein 1 [Varanus komodoensis]